LIITLAANHHVPAVSPYRYHVTDGGLRDCQSVMKLSCFDCGVRDLAHAGGRSVQRGHITRDIVFSKDGRQMFVSVGSASNAGEGMGKRDAAAIARWEAEDGLGSAWGNETDRAAVLVFDPDGRNRRVFATGLRNCVGLAVHPMTGDVWCSTNERDGLGDDLAPTSLRACVAALSTAGLGTIWAPTKILDIGANGRT
jgi:hypothetical protein